MNDDETRTLYINFIDVASNLRARCYGLPQIYRFKIENFAYDYNRNCVFTLQLAAALTIFEVIKYIQNKDIIHFRNSAVNMAINKYE